jgi:hypothetical protein
MTAASLYPCYKDLDPFLDVPALKALDGFVRERLERRLAAERDLAFFTGPFVLGESGETLPGARMVYLSRSERPDDYYDLDRTELWHPTPEAEEFAPLMEFLATLPFEATGRMLIIYDPLGRAVTPHRDHDSVDLCHEFVWLRSNLDKPFFMLDPDSGERRYVAGHAAWFDTVNQYHGGDATGELSWSIRVDGRFSEAFRRQIPFPETWRSMAPALWAQGRPAETIAATKAGARQFSASQGSMWNGGRRSPACSGV